LTANQIISKHSTLKLIKWREHTRVGRKQNIADIKTSLPMGTICSDLFEKHCTSPAMCLKLTATNLMRENPIRFEAPDMELKSPFAQKLQPSKE
jgi:hypothetical protein